MSLEPDAPGGGGHPSFQLRARLPSMCSSALGWGAVVMIALGPSIVGPTVEDPSVRPRLTLLCLTM